MVRPWLLAAQILVHKLAELGHGGIVGAEAEQRLLVVRRVLNRLVLHRTRRVELRVAKLGDRGKLLVGGAGCSLVLAVLVEQDAVDIEVGVERIVGFDGLDENIDGSVTITTSSAATRAFKVERPRDGGQSITM